MALVEYIITTTDHSRSLRVSVDAEDDINGVVTVFCHDVCADLEIWGWAWLWERVTDA